MNNEISIVELTEEQLDVVGGGSGFSLQGVNINVPVNLNVATTLNIAVLSKDVWQYGGSLNYLSNSSSQSIK
jgi:hypothetical protein